MFITRPVTDAGLQLAGEGLMCLIRSLSQGAKSTLVSLWRCPNSCLHSMLSRLGTHLASGKARGLSLKLAMWEQEEEMRVPESLDYTVIGGLSNEVVEKLCRVRPALPLS